MRHYGSRSVGRAGTPAVCAAAGRIRRWRTFAIQRADPAAGQLRKERRIRDLADEGRIKAFLSALGQRIHEDTKAYICGGATAVLYGFRGSTLDIDVVFKPDTDQLFSEIPRLKNELSINVELASPADFIPVKDDWEARSTFIGQFDRLSAYHFDVYAQALSKIERGHENDLRDVRAMVDSGLIEKKSLREYYDSVRAKLIRYPAIDPKSFERAVESFVNEMKDS